MLYPPELRARSLNGNKRRAAAMIKAAMDRNQMLVPALANVPTIIMVVIGILLDRRNIGALRSHMDACAASLTRLENTFARFDQKLAAGLDRAC